MLSTSKLPNNVVFVCLFKTYILPELVLVLLMPVLVIQMTLGNVKLSPESIQAEMQALQVVLLVTSFYKMGVQI